MGRLNRRLGRSRQAGCQSRRRKTRASLRRWQRCCTSAAGSPTTTRSTAEQRRAPRGLCMLLLTAFAACGHMGVCEVFTSNNYLRYIAIERRYRATLHAGSNDVRKNAGWEYCRAVRLLCICCVPVAMACFCVASACTFQMTRKHVKAMIALEASHLRPIIMSGQNLVGVFKPTLF